MGLPVILRLDLKSLLQECIKKVGGDRATAPDRGMASAETFDRVADNIHQFLGRAFSLPCTPPFPTTCQSTMRK